MAMTREERVQLYLRKEGSRPGLYDLDDQGGFYMIIQRDVHRRTTVYIHKRRIRRKR